MIFLFSGKYVFNSYTFIYSTLWSNMSYSLMQSV